MTEANTTEPTPAEKADRDKRLKQAYSAANTALREAHREEFDQLYAEEAKKRGVEYRPKPSKADKARLLINQTLEENPELQAEIERRVLERHGVVPDEPAGS